jgi:uncharacterized integral membrane protein
MSNNNELIDQNQELRKQIKKYRDDYKDRFIRNQYTNNLIIALSIILTVLIAITGTSPAFKDAKNTWSAPLGVSASAWLGLLSTALVSIQRLYNIQEKIAFYPAYIVKAEELLEDFDSITNQEELDSVRKQFKQMRADEALKRPIERSNI